MSLPRLADRLKVETAALHASVERSVYLSRLMGGQLQRPAYCALLRSLLPIYAALEDALTRHDCHVLIAPVWQPAMRRSAALRADLIALHGSDWADALTPVPQALSYADRLREVDRCAPALLLAHAYVRYLGDLSGGQVLRKIVGRNLALADGRGLAFYDFGGVDATRALSRGFRAGLESMNPDAATSDALLEEATNAFGRHQCLFDELAQQQALTGDDDQPGVVFLNGD